MEFLECIGLLTNTDVLDRLLEYSVNRKRCTAARVAVHLCEDDACDAERAVESLRDLHCFLSDHSVGNEKNFCRMKRILEMTELVHHLFVDLKSASSIDNHYAITITLGLFYSSLRNLHHVLRGSVGVNGNLELLSERLELIDGSGTIHVGCDESGGTTFALEFPRKLRSSCRFSRALQS